MAIPAESMKIMGKQSCYTFLNLNFTAVRGSAVSAAICAVCGLYTGGWCKQTIYTQVLWFDWSCYHSTGYYVWLWQVYMYRLVTAWCHFYQMMKAVVTATVSIHAMTSQHMVLRLALAGVQTSYVKLSILSQDESHTVSIHAIRCPKAKPGQ